MPGMRGLFEPLVEIGETVRAGQSLGLVHDRDHPDRAPSDVISPFAGILLAKTGHGPRGDRRRGRAGRA